MSGVPQYPSDIGVQVAALQRVVRELQTTARTQGGLPRPGVSGIKSYTASHDLALVDVGQLVQMNSAGSVTLTLPANSTTPIPIGRWGWFVQWGAGLLTVTPVAGVVIHAAGGRRIAANRYSVGQWIKTDTNEFLLSGDLTAP